MTDTQLAPLTPAELPLVLLAAVAHPDVEYRRDLALRLRSAIEQRCPEYPPGTLRCFFLRHRADLRLGPRLLRELAVLAGGVVFSSLATEQIAGILVSPGNGSPQAGYLVKRDLEVLPLAGCSLTRHRLRRQGAFTSLPHFLPELIRTRLSQFRRRESEMSAVCRVAGRLELELTSEKSWSSGVELVGISSRLPSARLEWMGFCQRWQGKILLLWPEMPEATLRFTAWLAEGKRLVLQHRDPKTGDGRKIVVRLRDFEGDCAEMKVLAGQPQAEAWLVRFPTLNMCFGSADHLAIARWAYPLNNWMNDDLVEKMI
jgi:hypothetical protein